MKQGIVWAVLAAAWLLWGRLQCELQSHDNLTDAAGTYCVRCGYRRRSRK